MILRSPRTVDSILSGITKLVTELRTAAEHNANESVALRSRADAHQLEADRAARAARKIGDLISNEE